MVHYYFRNRGALLDTLVAERLVPLIEYVWEPPAKARRPREMVRAIVARLMECAAQRPWLPPLWMREVVNEGGELRERVRVHLPIEQLRDFAQALTRRREAEAQAEAVYAIASRQHREGGIRQLALLDAQADLEAIARAAGGKKAALASHELARELTGCEIGAIPPFSFNSELHLIIDPTLRQRHDEIVFNAGRRDASIIMRTDDYFRIAQPELAAFVRA